MNSNWSYSPETPNLGQNRRFLEPCDLEIWWMTLKSNKEPLLSTIKVYASFYHHMWIQTGVTVRKRLSWFMTSVILTFDLWPLPFAWTSLLSLVITPENFVAIRWQEHSEKGVTDRQTDRQTERGVLRAAWSQLKTHLKCRLINICNFAQAPVFEWRHTFHKTPKCLNNTMYQLLLHNAGIYVINILGTPYAQSNPSPRHQVSYIVFFVWNKNKKIR